MSGLWPAATAPGLSRRRALGRALVAAALPVAVLLAGHPAPPPGPGSPGAATEYHLPAPHLVMWTGNASGPARSMAQSIPVSAAPTATASGRSVTVTWSATTMSAGTTVAGYVVKRYDTNGVAATMLSNCSGTVTGTSCVENLVPAGQWRYSVRAVTGNWQGAESALGATITVGNATLTFTSSTTITTLPATLNGTIANFGILESLQYRLDSPTGPILSGSPSNASALGGGNISVTIPAGTSDAPHSVFIVGGFGSVAAASINIVDPPDLVSLSMRDTDSNGKVDQVLATFNETLATYSAGVAPWTLANVPSGGTLSGVTVSGMVATLTLAEGAGAANTAAGSFTIALASNSAGIRDAHGHKTSFAATAMGDGAAPALLSLVMSDSSANGKVDRVVATFSEALASYTAGNTPWTLTSVPSSGTLASVAMTTPTVTLTITEGSGAADTAVGSFKVTMAGNAGGVRDAAGNLSSFSARAPSDGAKPIRLTTEMFDLTADGKIDSVTVGFSETLGAYSAGAGVWTLTDAPSGATVNTVSISGAVATLNLTQGTGAATTAVGTFKVALSANAAGVVDAAGNQSSFTAVAPNDKAPPGLTALQLLDNDHDGKVDHVTATFSEALASYTAGNTPWTLTNVPSGGSLSAVSMTTPTVTLTLLEGTGAADTTVGTMKVAMATHANGVRDAAANLSSFAATAPADKAGPVPVTITDTNGVTDGVAQTGDTLVVTFSEALAPGAVPSSTNITFTDPSGAGNDTLLLTNLTSGARSTGSNAYVVTNATSATFPGTVALSNGNKTITVTVGTPCSGTACGPGLAAPSGAQNFSFLAAATLTDPAGNLPITVAKTFAIRLF